MEKRLPAGPLGADGLMRGKRAVVTGAGMGVGRAAALRFAAEGASVVCVDRDGDAALSVVVEIESLGGEGLAAVADVSDEAQVAAAFQSATSRFGGVDVVVANAGVQLAGQDDRVDRLSLDVWRKTLDINLTGMFLTCKYGVQEMLTAGGGSIVCTCSPTSLYGVAPGYSAYSASKAGVLGRVRVMAADRSGLGIRVNGVIPGFTQTPMTSWVTPEEAAVLLRGVPIGRQGQPEDVADVMAFLASDGAAYVTGALWAADGGMTAV